MNSLNCYVDLDPIEMSIRYSNRGEPGRHTCDSKGPRKRSGYAGRSDSHVSPEVEYKPGVLSSDAVVSEADDILFFEVVAKRMSFVDSVIRLDEKAIGRDLEAGVVKKARQLHRNIEDYRSGALFQGSSSP